MNLHESWSCQGWVVNIFEHLRVDFRVAGLLMNQRIPPKTYYFGNFSRSQIQLRIMTSYVMITHYELPGLSSQERVEKHSVQNPPSKTHQNQNCHASHHPVAFLMSTVFPSHPADWRPVSTSIPSEGLSSQALSFPWAFPVVMRLCMSCLISIIRISIVNYFGRIV